MEPGEAYSTGGQRPEPNLTSRLLSIISDKTGYPLDMLHEHQNLEADLGIDSIKRVEILGMLFQQLGLTTVPTENLGSLRTVAEIVEFLSEASDTESPAPEEAGFPGPGDGWTPTRPLLPNSPRF